VAVCGGLFTIINGDREWSLKPFTGPEKEIRVSTLPETNRIKCDEQASRRVKKTAVESFINLLGHTDQLCIYVPEREMRVLKFTCCDPVPVYKRGERITTFLFRVLTDVESHIVTWASFHAGVLDKTVPGPGTDK